MEQSALGRLGFATSRRRKRLNSRTCRDRKHRRRRRRMRRVEDAEDSRPLVTSRALRLLTPPAANQQLRSASVDSNNKVARDLLATDRLTGRTAAPTTPTTPVYCCAASLGLRAVLAAVCFYRCRTFRGLGVRLC